MTALNKQTLRQLAEKATQGEWCVDDRHGVLADAGLNGNYYIASCSGPDHRANKQFIAAVNPAAVLALLDELEAAERRIAELSANNDSAVKALLKARHITVTLPGGYAARVGHPINETERSVMIPKDGGHWLSRFDVEHALRAAGIGVKGE